MPKTGKRGWCLPDMAKDQEGKPTWTRLERKKHEARGYTHLGGGADGVTMWSAIKKSDLLQGESCSGASNVWLECEDSTCHLPGTRGQRRTGIRKQCCDDIQSQAGIWSRKCQRQVRYRAEATALKGRK